ncbi:Histamine H2 receptor [Merluccius polli]|uniref:Histamine H2 receptor n=1 Tax=Merluccius polli TaxID=89951 RepID=A0AA47P091_MERPO|nr:Histamine H2 receptor [Merluccius polli]
MKTHWWGEGGTMMSTVLRWLVLVSVIVLTVGGNVLVRRLRRTSNCFVVSLAVTDLLLGLLVLPLSALLEIRGGRWPLGGVLCNIYISLDVMLCTAVTPCHASLAIAAIWTLSLAVSFVPIHLGWNTVDYSVQHADWAMGAAQQEGRYCHYEWNNSYVLLDSFVLFYLPLVLMCGVYLLIFRVAREQVRRIRATHALLLPLGVAAASAREHKAAVTLAAVLGAFVVCWFPYFTFYTCKGLQAHMTPPTTLHSAMLWLGYFNSALNPILYPALNRDFRRAYGELLRCRTAGCPCRGSWGGCCCCCRRMWWRRGSSNSRMPATHHRRVSLGGMRVGGRSSAEHSVAVIKGGTTGENGGRLVVQDTQVPNL